MATDLVIIGTGGQGRECLDIVRAMNADGARFKVMGFVDDNPSGANKAQVENLGHEVLGTLEEFLQRPRSAQACIGIGNGCVRRRISSRLAEAKIESPVLIHPSSSRGSNIEIGPGSAIWAGARLTTNIRIGRHVHINQNATVGHDSTLGDYSTVNPTAAISGDCTIEACSLIGAGAVVLQGRRVGTRAVVGAGACVVHDVPPCSVVKGIPAR